MARSRGMVMPGPTHAACQAAPALNGRRSGPVAERVYLLTSRLQFESDQNSASNSSISSGSWRAASIHSTISGIAMMRSQ